MRRIVQPLIALLLLSTATSGPAPSLSSPQILYGPLFAAVQGERIFPDSKTFADAVPKSDPQAIRRTYEAQRPTGPALRAFVLQHFDVPGESLAQQRALLGHIAALWPQLTRPPLDPPSGSSALALPAPYVVPGGRFREIYYWDSYFTMLGLKADGQQPLLASMIANFESLIQRHGFIPNGTRTYYLGRSQPPFFSHMVDLATPDDGPDAAAHLTALKAEHGFWMRGATGLAPNAARERVVRMPDGAILNRYWDDNAGPRDESWAEDVATARASGRRQEEVYRDLRAGAESGWDFSSRWLADPQKLASIRTTAIVPVDLNSLLWSLERTIARRCGAAGDQACVTEYNGQADKRGQAINRWLWLDREGRFADWDRLKRQPTARLSAATLTPLFVGLASAYQGERVAGVVRDRLLAPGGLRTTTLATGQQWDAPNGWAPLQWIAVEGLNRYDQEALARDIARRWIATVDATYRETGKMLEKYDVEQRKPGGGGEYPLQDGFGWTNGVTRALIGRYPDLAP